MQYFYLTAFYPPTNQPSQPNATNKSFHNKKCSTGKFHHRTHLPSLLLWLLPLHPLKCRCAVALLASLALVREDATFRRRNISFYSCNHSCLHFAATKLIFSCLLPELPSFAFIFFCLLATIELPMLTVKMLSRLVSSSSPPFLEGRMGFRAHFVSSI